MPESVAQECRQIQARAHELMGQTAAIMRKHRDKLPSQAVRDLDVARESFSESVYYVGRACGDYPDTDAASLLSQP